MAQNIDGSYEFTDVVQNITVYCNSALCFAACNGHIEVVKSLLAKNVDGSYEFPDGIQKIQQGIIML